MKVTKLKGAKEIEIEIEGCRSKENKTIKQSRKNRVRVRIERRQGREREGGECVSGKMPIEVSTIVFPSVSGV